MEQDSYIGRESPQRRILKYKNTHTMTIYTVDDSRPFLTRNERIIRWEGGDIAARIASSRLVRIHSRGIVFVPLVWEMRDLNLVSTWKMESPCLPSHEGLCSTQEGKTVYFPTSRPPLINEKLWDWRCNDPQNKNTGRLLTGENIYEPSACDVLDAGFDFVYADASIYYRDSSMQPWIYWTICVLVVFLVRCLSKYILASINLKRDELPNPWVCITAAIVTFILVTYQGDSVFVTEEDMVFYWFSVAYSVFYAVLFLFARVVRVFMSRNMPFSSLKDPPFYNLLAGVLQLVASRFYFSAMTPYNLPIIFVISVRANVKSRRKCPDMVRASTLLLDAFMLSLLCVLGFRDASEFLVALFCAAASWSDYLL